MALLSILREIGRRLLGVGQDPDVLCLVGLVGSALDPNDEFALVRVVRLVDQRSLVALGWVDAQRLQAGGCDGEDITVQGE